MTTNHEFKIIREPLIRKDGKDTMYDAVYNSNTGKQLSVVTRKYQLIPHKEIVNSVLSILDNNKINYTEPKIKLLKNGGLMDCDIVFPDKAFEVDDGDEYYPRILLQNSYNAGRSFNITFGVFRLICSNGAMIVIKKFYSLRQIHIYNNIDLEKIQTGLIKNLNQIEENMVNNYNKLSKMDGLTSLKGIVVDNRMKIPNKYKQLAMFNLSNQEGINLELVKENDKTNDIICNQIFSAYLLWNIFTAIATHKVQSLRSSRIIGDRISNYFLG